MSALAPARLARLVTIHLATRQPTEFIDLTDRLGQVIEDSGARIGIINVQTLHTTTAIVVNEHEPLLLHDFQALLERAAPHGACYAHDDMFRRTSVPDGERTNGHAHCRAMLLATSACLTFTDGRLLLGQWQRVFFVELDGPRSREITVLVIGEPAP
jgi:secondary thiamine-phosphate synthase enzyme